jgi:hypothetical protein
MSLILMIIGLPFLAIHYYNGRTFEEIVPLASIVVLVWMIDVMVNLSLITRPIKYFDKAQKGRNRSGRQ